jgi:hypothetical protein
LPLSLLQRPIWDGALSRYAESTSYALLNKEAIDFSFPTLYFYEQAMVYLSNFLEIDFFVIYNASLGLALGILFQQIIILGKKLEIYPQSKKREAAIGLLFVLFPGFHTLYTTQNFPYILCLVIFLIGINQLFGTNVFIKILGLIFILCAFQMASIPFMFLIIYWWQRWKFHKNNFRFINCCY